MAAASSGLFALSVLGCGGSTTQQGATTAPATEPKEVTSPRRVIDMLERAGLPIGAVKNYTASSDPNELLGRPGQYTGKANFQDKRLTPSQDFDISGGGSVETFANEDEAAARYEYVGAIAEGSALFAEYDFLEGTVVLRLSKELTPAQVKAYEKALRGGATATDTTSTEPAASEAVYVPTGAGSEGLEERPSVIGLGASAAVEQITWQRYGGQDAIGRGVFPQNDCDPSCAEGNVTDVPVSIRLWNIAKCHGRRTYLALDMDGQQYPLQCPP